MARWRFKMETIVVENDNSKLINRDTIVVYVNIFSFTTIVFHSRF